MEINSLLVLYSKEDCDLLPYSHKYKNDNMINGNNNKENIREEIILIRDRVISKKKLNCYQDSKMQNTVDNFVVNSLLINNK